MRIPRTDIKEIARFKERRKKSFWTGTKIGANLGFGSGLITGLEAGDDGIFDDMTAGFNGMVLGGRGTGAGAIIGYAADKAGSSSEILYSADSPVKNRAIISIPKLRKIPVRGILFFLDRILVEFYTKSRPRW